MTNQEIQNLIKEFIEKTVEVVGEVTITTEGAEGKPQTTWFIVEAKNPHVYLNREGEALFALNYLAKKIIESKLFPIADKNEHLDPPSRKHNDIIIDINGFHKKKIENIHATVHMMAERARYFKSSVEINPMPAFERRIVHEFLSDATDLKTESEGTGPYRRVVIKYVGAN